MRKNKQKSPRFPQKLKGGSAAFALGASLLLPSGEATATQPTLDSPQQTISQRIARVREQLRRQDNLDAPAPASNTLRDYKQLSQYPWANWPNWRNW